MTKKQNMYQKHILILGLLFISALLTSNVANAQELIKLNPIALESDEDLADIKILGKSINKMSKKIMDCMDTNKSHIECQCMYLNNAKEYQLTLADTLAKHPEWKDGSTFYISKNEDGDTVGTTTSFIGLEMESKRIDELECN